MAINAPLFETVPRPTYQKIALQARQLTRLGLTYAAIARRVGVTGKTVAKTIAWVDRESRA